MRQLIAFLMLLVLTACVTPNEFSDEPFDEQRYFEENYQVVYARTLRQMRNCWGEGLSIGSSNSIDGQLYSELGYGEIIEIANVLGVLSPRVEIRIERSGSGALASVKLGNVGGRDFLRKGIFGWISGETSCRFQL